MHRLTFGLLWVLVFSLQWELLVTVDRLGTASRLIGLAAVGAGALALLGSGRLRRPGAIVALSLLFMSSAMLTMLWTLSPSATLQQVITYAQLLGLVWLIWQFAGSLEAQRSLMVAYILGAYVSFVELYRNLATGVQIGNRRYSVSNFDPNDLGLTLAIGIPMAWHLALSRRGIVRGLAAAYVPLAVVGVLLTASRGAVLALLVALSIVPLTLTRRSLRTMAVVVLLLATTVVGAATLVPDSSWTRLVTLRNELESGTLSGRFTIWSAGALAFRERALIGAGAGAFEQAVEPIIGRGSSAHNVFLAIAVEQGIVGLVAFGLLMFACGAAILRLPRQERRIWSVVAGVWLVGAMSLGWQARKITWLIVALVAVQAARLHHERRSHGTLLRPPHRVPDAMRTRGPSAAA